jgi:hypothetical protein
VLLSVCQCPSKFLLRNLIKIEPRADFETILDRLFRPIQPNSKNLLSTSFNAAFVIRVSHFCQKISSYLVITRRSVIRGSLPLFLACFLSKTRTISNFGCCLELFWVGTSWQHEQHHAQLLRVHGRGTCTFRPVAEVYTVCRPNFSSKKNPRSTRHSFFRRRTIFLSTFSQE